MDDLCTSFDNFNLINGNQNRILVIQSIQCANRLIKEYSILNSIKDSNNGLYYINNSLERFSQYLDKSLFENTSLSFLIPIIHKFKINHHNLESSIESSVYFIYYIDKTILDYIT